MKRFLVFSDSHGRASQMAEVIAKKDDIDDIIYLGDGEHDIDCVRDMFPNKNYYCVGGNCDFGSRLERFSIIFAGNKKIGICHGHLFWVKESLDKLISHGEKAGFDAILFGHTHIQKSIKTPKGLRLLNPGAIMNGRYAVLTCGDEICAELCRE